MTTELPAQVPLSAGLGLAFPERDYLVWDPFDGRRHPRVRGAADRPIQPAHGKGPHGRSAA